MQLHVIKASSEHLRRSHGNEPSTLPPASQGLDCVRTMHTDAPSCAQKCFAWFTSNVEQHSTSAAAVARSKQHDTLSFGTWNIPAAYAAAFSGMLVFHTSPAAATSAAPMCPFPVSSSIDAHFSGTCVHNPATQTLNYSMSHSWHACLLAVTLSAVALSTARYAFSVVALSMKQIVIPRMQQTYKVLAAAAVVLVVLPQGLRPPLWTLLVAFPTVRIHCCCCCPVLLITARMSHSCKEYDV
jgi:hypothetical protein